MDVNPRSNKPVDNEPEWGEIDLKEFPLSQKITAFSLLQEAAKIYDNSHLSQTAQQSWRTGFQSGAYWMGLAMQQIRNESIVIPKQISFQQLGIIKYLLALLPTILVLYGVYITQFWGLLPIAICVFYAVEVQMVFLFPLAIDTKTSRVFATSYQMTKKSGGTLNAMSIVLPVACVMLLGGLFGRGFIRSWCLGCLSIVLWYEKLRSTFVELQSHRIES